MEPEPEKVARTCRWATPTLFLRWPLWLDSWSWPWSCARDGKPRLLSSQEGCRNCSGWDVREPGSEPPPFSTSDPIQRD